MGISSITDKAAYAISQMLGGAKIKIESFTREELIGDNKVSYKDLA